MASGFGPGARKAPLRTRPLVLCSSISLRVEAFHFPLRTTPGRLCHRWSGKLMINWTSFSAGPSDSAIRRASSGVRRFMIYLLDFGWIFYSKQNFFGFQGLEWLKLGD